MIKTRKELRRVRHKRIRAKISGDAEVPRVCVFKSSKHIYAQVIDDSCGKTLFHASSLTPEVCKRIEKQNSNLEKAKAVGIYLGEISVSGGLKKVKFDRSGYPFHGRVRSLVEGMREKGLEF